MAQADGVVANGTGSAVRSDINNQYAALWSNHSGSTEPSSGKVAYQLWADTNSGYLKIRNAANNAWIQLFKLDGTDLADICRLTGSTNNTVCTVTGANAITGEAKLTFNGSGDLTVTGNEGTSANLYLIADEGDDNGDGWRVGSNQDDNDLTFANNTSGSYVDKLTLFNNGNVKINDGDLVIGTAGHGIDFSAVSHAGGMTSELLDSYEEGTFTPYMRGTGGSVGSYAQSNLSGTYTKIGNLVYFSLQAVLTNLGSYSGQFKWGGLPFTARAGDNYSISMSSYPSTVVDGVMRVARVNANQDYGSVMSGSRLDVKAPYSEIVTGYYLSVAGCYQAA